MENGSLIFYKYSYTSKNTEALSMVGFHLETK